MGDGIDEAVVLLAAAKLPHQEARVHDHTGDDQGKKDDAEKQQHSLAPVENDPSNIEGDRERHQGTTQANEENDGSAAARDAHGVRRILPLGLRSRQESKIFNTEDTEEHGVNLFQSGATLVFLCDLCGKGFGLDSKKPRP